MKHAFKSLVVAGTLALGSAAMTPAAMATEYVIDTKGAHASINFKASHLGYSFIVGRFNTFTGTFSYDPAAPEKASIMVDVETTSVNTNHAERDKHLNGAKFMNTAAFPTAKFVSTSVKPTGEGKAEVKGNLTFHGVTKEIVVDATYIGSGKDPWGGNRAGFVGTTNLVLMDFGIERMASATEVSLEIHVEGIAKK